MSVLERIRDALSGATDREQPRSIEPAASTESIASPAPTESAASSGSTAPGDPAETRASNLYRCDPCGTTYVSEGMDACSQCSASVERIPTEQDLGIV